MHILIYVRACICACLLVCVCVCVILIATHMNMQISFRECMCSALKPTLRCWPNFTLQCTCMCVCTCLSMHFAKLGKIVWLRWRCVSRCVWVVLWVFIVFMKQKTHVINLIQHIHIHCWLWITKIHINACWPNHMPLQTELHCCSVAVSQHYLYINQCMKNAHCVCEKRSHLFM